MKFHLPVRKAVTSADAPGRRAAKGGLSGRIAGVRADLTAKRADLLGRNDEMLASAADGTRRGTRKRGAVMAAAGLGATAVMVGMVSANILAVNFTTSNTEFKLYSNYLDAEQAAAFLSPSTKANGAQQGLSDLGIKTAKLSGLCIIQQEAIGALGTWSFVLTAGDAVPDSYTQTEVPAGVVVDANTGKLTGASATGAVSANNLYINSDTITGYGNKISGLNLGQSASTVGTSAGISWPTLAQGQTQPAAGNFGLYAQQLNVAGLGGESFGLNLQGAITLPKLSIKLQQGAKTQTDCS